jgi:hypothetical protein
MANSPFDAPYEVIHTSPEVAPLFEAILAGDEGAFAAALANGIGVESLDAFGQTPLIEAARQGRLEMARELLQREADPLKASRSGCTALISAAQEGHAELVALLAPVSDLSAVDRLRMTALCGALLSPNLGPGHIACAKRLLRRESALAQQGVGGQNAFQSLVDAIERAETGPLANADRLASLLGLLGDFLRLLNPARDPFCPTLGDALDGTLRSDAAFRVAHAYPLFVPDEIRHAVICVACQEGRAAPLALLLSEGFPRLPTDDEQGPERRARALFHATAAGGNPACSDLFAPFLSEEDAREESGRDMEGRFPRLRALVEARAIAAAAAEASAQEAASAPHAAPHRL